MRLCVLLLVALAAAGCVTRSGGPQPSGGPPSSAGPQSNGSALLDTYLASAGDPVTSFRIDRGFNRWTGLGPRHLAVWTGSNEAYLLELGASCPDLENAIRIALTGENQRVEAGFDGVIVQSAVTTVAPSRCTIARIRPLDIRALDARQSERTQIDAVGREALN